MLFYELYKILVNKVTFVGCRGRSPPPLVATSYAYVIIMRISRQKIRSTTCSSLFCTNKQAFIDKPTTFTSTLVQRHNRSARCAGRTSDAINSNHSPTQSAVIVTASHHRIGDLFPVHVNPASLRGWRGWSGRHPVTLHHTH